MNGQVRAGRLRLSVAGVDGAVYDMGPEDLSPDVAAARPEVRPLAVTAVERAAGISRYEVTTDGWVLQVVVEPLSRALLRERADRAGDAAAHAGPAVVRAQMPGRVVRLWVAEGDTVEAGQRLLALEAMKMENEVRAPRAGTIGSIAAAAGSSVELGDELLTVR